MDRNDVRSAAVSATQACVLVVPTIIKDEMKMLGEVADDLGDLAAISLKLEVDFGLEILSAEVNTEELAKMTFGRFVDFVWGKSNG
jgi:hypothetical protein